MARLNLTLDHDTWEQLDRQAKKRHTRRAAVARDLLCEALARQARLERQRKLAADYAADRADARDLLGALESGQLDLLQDD